jgi:DNA-binding beta-propeller fold protein YncE
MRYSDGTHLRTIGSYGSGAGQFQYPVGVAFDAAGNIVVVEQDNHRVQVLRYSDGAHLRTIGSRGSGNNGQFNQPHVGIAIDSDGRIIVADTYNDRASSRVSCHLRPPPLHSLSLPPLPSPEMSVCKLCLRQL